MTTSVDQSIMVNKGLKQLPDNVNLNYQDIFVDIHNHTST